MAKYDKQFGFKETKDTESFHRSRRMFVIKDDQLIIAGPNLPYSHPVWFEKEGWMDEHDDEFLKMNVRGAVMPDSEIRFYIDWDFQISEEAEQKFMLHLKELVDILGLDTNAQLGGGLLREEGFRPRKLYKKIKDNLEP